MAYSDHEQALRVASAISAVATGCCLGTGCSPASCANPSLTSMPKMDAFLHYYDLLRTIGLSTTEDMIHPTRTWLICRVAVPEPVERYFLQGFHRWQVEWLDVVSPEGIVLPTDPVLMSLQTIVGLSEATRDHTENSGNVRLVAQPGGGAARSRDSAICAGDDGDRDRSVVGGTQAVGGGHTDGQRQPLISRLMAGISNKQQCEVEDSCVVPFCCC